MMIKGGLIRPQLARLGKIVIGEKGEVRTSTKGTEFQLPQKLDHFVIKSLYRNAQGQLVDDTVLMTRLGDQPRELKIRLPFNHLEANFLCELRYYKGGMLYCSGDGEQAMRRTEIGQQKSRPSYGAPKPFGPCGEACPDFQERRCRRFGALRVMLEEQQQVGGIYEFRTTSRHSIENILSGLLTIQAQTGGVLAWVPLTMRLVPQTVTTPEGTTSQVYVIQIVFDGSPHQLLMTVRDILALRAPLLSEIKSLEAGLPMAEDDAIDARETQDEFYPEQSSAEVVHTSPAEPQEAAAEVVERPTADQITRLIDLAQQCGIDLATFAQRLREWMRWPAEVKITKKFLRESMTMPEYEEVWGIFTEQRATQQTQDEEQPLDQTEDDVSDFSGPDAAVSPQEAAQLSGESPETSKGEIVQPEPQWSPIDHPPAGDAATGDPAQTPAPESARGGGGDVGKYATAQQIARLKTLAEHVGKDASADIQDMLDHHREGVALEVYRVVRERLLTRQAEQEKRAATKVAAQATTEA